MSCRTSSYRTWFAMAVFILFAAVWICPMLTAQTVPPVVSSSIVGLNHPDWTDSLVGKLAISSKGDVLVMDRKQNAIYQFPADGGAVKTLVPPPPNVFGTGQWSVGGISFDKNDNLYIGHRYSNEILKIPYDPVQKTWNVVISADTKFAVSSGPAVMGLNSGGWMSPADQAIIDPGTVSGDGSPDIYITDENGLNCIYRYNPSGKGFLIAGGFKAAATRIAADRAGNVYFIENVDAPHVTGVFRLPVGTTNQLFDNSGTTEQGWPQCGPGVVTPCRVDNGLTDTKGVAVDYDGNVYISDENDKYSTDTNNSMQGMLAMVPNEGGIPNSAHQMILAPVPAVTSSVVDPKGFLYVPTWGPPNGFNGMSSIVKVFLGSAALQASAIATQGNAATVYYSFNADTTPDGFSFIQAGAASQDFASLTGGNCALGTTYTANQRCTVQVALNSQVVGPTNGELVMTAGGATAAKTYIHGEGQGAALSILTPAAENAIRSGLSAVKQIASDRWGNFYVADSGSGKVQQYPKGASDSTTPVAIGSFTAPTGVAVDGHGNVFVADSGNVYKVPYEQTGLNGAHQAVVQGGFGANSRLAIDGTGSVYVADPANHRVVKIPNTDTKLITGSSVITVGSGFTAPSAVAVDDAGDVYAVDGTTLTEILVTGAQTALTSELSSPVGVALDASGSVYVAQAGGVVRIPKISGALDYTKKVAIGVDVTTPNDVAVDTTGMVYVADGGTAGIVTLGVNGAIDFGFVNFGDTAAQTATLFNIGNQQLTLSSPLYTSNGPNTSDFGVATSGDLCTGATLDPGTTCNVDMAMTPASGLGILSDSGTINSNAANGANITLSLTGNATGASAPTQVTATYLPTTPVYPSDLTISVSVAPTSGSGTPTGNIRLTVDGQAGAPVPLTDGAAQTTLRKPNGGAHVIIVKYLGDANYGSSSQTLNVTIGRASTTTVFTAPPSYVMYQGGFNLQAQVTSTGGLPTGTVVFKEGGNQIGTGTLDATGNVKFDTSSLAHGSHTVTATYQGDSNFTGSDAGSVTFNVIDPSVGITSASPNVVITNGVAAGTTITVSALVGFNSTVQLACVNLPQYSECTFDWPQLAVQTGSPRDVKVLISPNVPVNIGALQTPAGRGLWWPTGTFAVALVGLVFGKKSKYNGRLLTIICAVLIISSAMVGMSACSGGGYTKTPPAPHVTTPLGTTMVTITATDIHSHQVVSIPFQLQVTVQ